MSEFNANFSGKQMQSKPDSDLEEVLKSDLLDDNAIALQLQSELARHAIEISDKDTIALAVKSDEFNDELIDDELFLRLDEFFNSQLKIEATLHSDLENVSQSDFQTECKSLSSIELLDDAPNDFHLQSELEIEHRPSTSITGWFDDDEIAFRSETPELDSEQQPVTTPQLLDDAEMAFQLQLDELASLAGAEIQRSSVSDADGCYAALLELEDTEYVPNYEPFDCPICLVNCDTIQGVQLRNCLHSFCTECIGNIIQHSEDAEIKCPFVVENLKCDSLMTDREIRALVTEERYRNHLEKSLIVAERSANSFHCRTPNCKGFCFYEENYTDFICSICEAQNCFNCRVRIYRVML